MTATQKQNRRYYLHRRLKKNKINYSPFKKTVYVDSQKQAENQHIDFLRKEFDYSVQLQIPQQ